MVAENNTPYQDGQFQSTRWSLVVAAKKKSSHEAKDALATLCQTYWYPLFVFIRRQGHAPAEAQDLTQSLFTSLLEHNFLDNVDQSKGRFRSYLLAACKKHLAQHHRTANAQKRGGDVMHIPLDFETAERRYQLEPSHHATADQLFAYRWSVTLIDRVLERLQTECDHNGKGDLFACVKGHLDGRKTTSYKETAKTLGMQENAVKVAAHRLRQRFAQLFRDEIAHTVAAPEEIDDEIRAVFQTLELGRSTV